MSENIADGMIRGMKDFFKDYKGCRNCRHQPEPLTMCDYGKRRTRVELICIGWEPKDGDTDGCLMRRKGSECVHINGGQVKSEECKRNTSCFQEDTYLRKKQKSGSSDLKKLSHEKKGYTMSRYTEWKKRQENASPYANEANCRRCKYAELIYGRAWCNGFSKARRIPQKTYWSTTDGQCTAYFPKEREEQ